jgi:hypothetical protein
MGQQPIELSDEEKPQVDHAIVADAVNTLQNQGVAGAESQTEVTPPKVPILRPITPHEQMDRVFKTRRSPHSLIKQDTPRTR